MSRPEDAVPVLLAVALIGTGLALLAIGFGWAGGL